MSAHDLAAARLEALNMRTERDAAQAEAAALRDTLDGVRAKTCGLPQYPVTVSSFMPGGGWVYQSVAAVRLRDVLALIDEAAAGGTAPARTVALLDAIDCYARDGIEDCGDVGDLLALRHLVEALTRIVNDRPTIAEFAEVFAARAAEALDLIEEE